MDLNELTKKLLAEGYTKESPPEYVKEWSDYDGGFLLKEDYKSGLTFITPCGLLCKYKSTMSDMSYMGIDWRVENDCSIIHCPYKALKKRCEKNHSLLEDMVSDDLRTGRLRWCAVKTTDQPYNYDSSVDRLDHIAEQTELQKKKEFIAQKKGHVCLFQAFYNQSTEKWHQSYDVKVCLQNNCNFCELRQKDMTSPKVNIFYDYKITYIEKGFGLLPDSEDVIIYKNNKFNKSPISEALAQAVLSQVEKEIKSNLHYKYDFHVKNGWIKSFEILQVKIERKVKHDIYEDLDLIRQGVKVSYADVLEKQKIEKKSENRRKAQQKNFEKIRSAYITSGYKGLGKLQYGFDRLMRQDKIDIDEWDTERKSYLESQKNQAVQLSFFD